MWKRTRPALAEREAGKTNAIVATQVEAAQAAGAAPVLVCSGATRRHLKSLTQHGLPGLTVLSYHEILPSVRVTSTSMRSTARKVIEPASAVVVARARIDAPVRARARALAEVQAVVEAQTGEKGVEDLYFTSFVVQ